MSGDDSFASILSDEEENLSDSDPDRTRVRDPSDEEDQPDHQPVDNPEDSGDERPAPVPVAHSTAEPVIMAAPAIPRAEIASRLQVDEQILDAGHHLTAEDGRETSSRKSNHAIETADHILKSLTNTAFNRFAGLADGVRQDAQVEWRLWKREREQQLDEAREKYNQLFQPNGNDQNKADSGPSTEILLNICQSKIENLTSQIESRLQKIETEVTGLGNNAVTKATYMELSTRTTAISQMIKPEMSNLFDERAKIDPSKHADVYKALSTHVNKYMEQLDKLQSDIHKLQMDDSTFHQPSPGASTPNQSLNAEDISALITAATTAASAASSKRRSQYDFGKNPLPTFDGDPIDYPSWKEEMTNDVLPDKGAKQQLRLMAKLSPNKDLPRLFKSPEEAWLDLDSLYANPVVVAEKVIRAFNDSNSLEGNSDEARVISLHKRIKSLYLTLEVVGEEEQLTHHKPLINDAIRLLPEKYRVEFAKEIMKEQKTLDPKGRELTAQEKYKLLTEWLEENAKTFTIYCGSMENSSNKEREEKKPGKTRVHTVDVKRKQDSSGSTGGAGKKGPKGSSRYGDECLDDIPAKVMENIKKQWEMWGPCPACNSVGHVFEGNQGWAASNSYTDCKTFMSDWDVDTRAEFIMRCKACVRCLSRSHSGEECRKSEDHWYCRVKENGQLCKGKHSNHLHGTKTQLWNAVISVTSTRRVSGGDDTNSSSHNELNQDALLPVASIKIKKGCWATVLFDTGASCSLIRDSFAQRCGLKPKKVTQMVTVCGEAPKLMELNYYRIVIKTDLGPREMHLLGLERLSTVPGHYDLSVAYSLFPHVPAGSLERPGGHLDLLIGQDHTELLPGGGLGADQRDQLRVWTIPFSGGRRVLTGKHPHIKFENPVKGKNVQKWNHALFAPATVDLSTTVTEPDSFPEAETMGYDIPEMAENEKCFDGTNDNGNVTETSCISGGTDPAILEKQGEVPGLQCLPTQDLSTTMPVINLSTTLSAFITNKLLMKNTVTREFNLHSVRPSRVTVLSDHQCSAYLRYPRSQWQTAQRGSFVSTVPAKERNKMEVSGEIVDDVRPCHLHTTKGMMMLFIKILSVTEMLFSNLARIIRILSSPGDRASTERIAPVNQLQTECPALLTAVEQLSYMMEKKGNHNSGYESPVVLPAISRLVHLPTLHAHIDDHHTGGIVQRVRRTGDWIIKGAVKVCGILNLRALWFDQVCESLVPIKKWRQTTRNVQMGDIALLRYVSKCSPPTFRYRKIHAVFPDANDVVRDVTVGTRPRRGRQKSDVRTYQLRSLDEQRVPVQRLSMLLPIEEQAELPPASDELHICEEDLRVPAAGHEAHSTSGSHSPGPEAPINTAQGPEESNDVTAPLDYDRLVVNSIIAYTAVCSEVQHVSEYYCWECDFREKFMYDQR